MGGESSWRGILWAGNLASVESDNGIWRVTLRRNLFCFGGNCLMSLTVNYAGSPETLFSQAETLTGGEFAGGDLLFVCGA